MLLRIDLQSEVPIYTQLVNQIIEGIAGRQLTPGEALPSVRGMAADLGINLHTVNKAYQLLKQEGYVQIHRQKGVIINPDGFPSADDDYMVRMREQLRPLVAEAVCREHTEEQFVEECRNLFQQFKAERL
ncbi:GntR family transcriptional regulator [Paenibacillus tarimensis]